MFIYWKSAIASRKADPRPDYSVDQQPSQSNGLIMPPSAPLLFIGSYQEQIL
jgi:hypothetical protein